jgi:hypothetical protein
MRRGHLGFGELHHDVQLMGESEQAKKQACPAVKKSATKQIEVHESSDGATGNAGCEPLQGTPPNDWIAREQPLELNGFSGKLSNQLDLIRGVFVVPCDPVFYTFAEAEMVVRDIDVPSSTIHDLALTVSLLAISHMTDPEQTELPSWIERATLDPMAKEDVPVAEEKADPVARIGDRMSYSGRTF